jgi:hypothetical protein
MQPLRLAANSEPGFIDVLDQCRSRKVAQGIGKTPLASGTILTDAAEAA